MAITLYYDPASGPARIIAVFLDIIKDTTVVRTQISLAAKDQMKPEFIEMNPHHTVPTLKDDETGLCLYESTAILQYLAEKLGATGKYGLPTDEKAKWATINCLHNYHNFIAKANMDVMGAFYRAFFSGQPLDLEAFKAGVVTAKDKYKLLEAVLVKNGGYISGPEATIADLRAWIDIFQVSNLGGAGTMAVIDFSEEFPAIQKWLLAVKEDAFSESAWAACTGFYGMAAQMFGGPIFRLAEQQ